MMRLFHSADWHLGHSLHGFDRSEEHDAAIDAMLEIICREKVDAAILAGDLYHVANPSVDAQRAFFRFIRALSDQAPHVDLVVIAGNHDSGPRLELPQELGLGARIRILGAPPRNTAGPDPAAAVVPLRDVEGAHRAALIALPYPRPGDLYGLAKGDAEGGPNGAREIRSFLAQAAAHARDAYGGLPLVITTHLHVRGGRGTGESERPILIGGEDAVPLSDFPEDAAYVALGHLHRPQTLSGPPLAVYSGAPIPLSCAEARYEQSVCIVDLERSESGHVAKLRRIPLPRHRQFLRAPQEGALPLDALEEELKALARRLNKDPLAAERPPFLEIAVALEGPEPELRRRIEAALGEAPVRLVRIHRIAPENAAPQGEPVAAPEPPNPVSAFTELHEMHYGAPPPEPLSDAFRALLQTALDGSSDAFSGKSPDRTRSGRSGSPSSGAAEAGE